MKFERIMKWIYVELTRVMSDNPNTDDQFQIIDYSKQISKTNLKYGRIVIQGFNLEESQQHFRDYIQYIKVKAKNKIELEFEKLDEEV